MGVYRPGAGTLGCVVWPGAVITHSQGVPPHFHPPHMNVGTPILPPPLCLTVPSLPGVMTPLLLPVWTNVASSNLWLLDIHTA